MDKLKVIKRLIALCWIVLILCFLVKIFGGNYFEIVVTNQRIINLSIYIESNNILKYGIYLILNLFTNIVYLLAVCGRKSFKTKELIFILIILILFYFVKLWNDKIGLITDFIQTFILPMFFMKPKEFYRMIIGFGLDLAFQCVCAYTKELGITNISLDENFITNIIWCLDYYIMLVLYYLYSNQLKLRKER